MSDAQLQYLLDREGGVLRAVAAACELLARQWARVTNISVGGRSESLGSVAEQWAKRAEALRAQYGGAGEGMLSIGTIRADGYSDDIASDEIDAASGVPSFTYVRPTI